MRGQITFVSEIMIDVLTLIVCVAFFIGFLLQFSTYNVIVHQNVKERIAIDFLNVLTKNRCLTDEFLIFNSTKLQEKNLCTNYKSGFRIVCENKEWDFDFKENQKHLKFPIIVNLKGKKEICRIEVNIE